MNWKDKLPRPEAIEFSAWPQEATLEDYSRATDEVIGGIRNLSNHASVYQFGGVGTPGLSDLDFLMVLNDKEARIRLDRWETLERSFSPMTKYILLHRPFIVNSSLWQEFVASHTFTDVKHLSGPILAPPKEADRSTAISHLVKEVEARVFRPYRGLIAPVLRRQVRVRPFLAGLFQLRYKAMVLAEFGIENPAWSMCATEISQLRDDWFSMARGKQLHAMYELAITCLEIESEMMEELSRLMRNDAISVPELEQTDKDIVAVFDDRTCFVKDFGAGRSLEYAVSSWEIAGLPFYMLPASFLAPFLFYMARGTNLKRYLGHRLAVFTTIPNLSNRDFDPGLVARLELLDGYLKFVEDRKLEWGILFEKWSEPRKAPETAGQFWERMHRHLSHPNDMIALGLRRLLMEAQAELAAITGSTSWRATAALRQFRKKLAPADGFLDRVVQWSLAALAPLRDSPQGTDD